MDGNESRAELNRRLAKWQELAREYPTGPTAEIIREMQDEIAERIRKLDTKEGRFS